jgi:uncharacterized Zn ribbon protein
MLLPLPHPLGGGFQLKVKPQQAAIIKNGSSFHCAKLAQGDQGIDSGQQKMRPVIFPTLPEGL